MTHAKMSVCCENYCCIKLHVFVWSSREEISYLPIHFIQYARSTCSYSTGFYDTDIANVRLFSSLVFFSSSPSFHLYNLCLFHLSVRDIS